ncbi:TIGR02206 family membrane protein [Kocuria sediminis]|uniref:TIGR02206 family membrane protein n=1 Tax=Kocuria sediminis TaxID=1038857 RepID=A0A6N8GNC4_9MICC|nr:TIGR02206 family membrane protein [Kocuria sediminis]
MPNEDVFVPYGPTHWAALGVCALGAVVVVGLGRRLRDSGAEVLVSRVFAAVLGAYAVAMLVYRWLPDNFDVHISLPVHLSDVAWMAAVIALWTRAHWAFALTYYWGLTLNTQAVLTPALDSPDFPHIDFIDLWVQHLLVLWAALYLTWGRGDRVDWRSYRLTLTVTVAWAAVVFGLNSRLGTNYGFLNGKPNHPSILDLFGPWPWYLLVEFLIITAVWALITWPWDVRRPGRTRTRADAAGRDSTGAGP